MKEKLSRIVTGSPADYTDLRYEESGAVARLSPGISALRHSARSRPRGSTVLYVAGVNCTGPSGENCTLNPGATPGGAVHLRKGDRKAGAPRRGSPRG